MSKSLPERQWSQTAAVIRSAPLNITPTVIPALDPHPLIRSSPGRGWMEQDFTTTKRGTMTLLLGGLSALTVHKHHRVLYEALKYGVKHGILVRNAAEAVDPPRGQSKKPATLGASDIQLTLDARKETPYYVLLFTAAYTGLRRGELLGLRWCDIDLENSTLSVVQTLQQLRNGEYIFKEPKSKLVKM